MTSSLMPPKTYSRRLDEVDIQHSALRCPGCYRYGERACGPPYGVIELGSFQRTDVRVYVDVQRKGGRRVGGGRMPSLKESRIA